jgi:hypothetical protein
MGILESFASAVYGRLTGDDDTFGFDITMIVSIISAIAAALENCNPQGVQAFAEGKRRDRAATNRLRTCCVNAVDQEVHGPLRKAIAAGRLYRAIVDEAEASSKTLMAGNTVMAGDVYAQIIAEAKGV